mmetsp:Transcript_38220/g.61325  ORF Transcript_38220/g.61325 Transcript_38220/m.61325 type:complete len:90 (-) Transcript_38220:11-280(-)
MIKSGNCGTKRRIPLDPKAMKTTKAMMHISALERCKERKERLYVANERNRVSCSRNLAFERAISFYFCGQLAHEAYQAKLTCCGQIRFK